MDGHFRAKWEHHKKVRGLLYSSQDHNLALTVLYGPCSLGSRCAFHPTNEECTLHAWCVLWYPPRDNIAASEGTSDTADLMPLRRKNMATYQGISVTSSVEPPLCPYGVAYH